MAAKQSPIRSHPVTGRELQNVPRDHFINRNCHLLPLPDHDRSRSCQAPQSRGSSFSPVFLDKAHNRGQIHDGQDNDTVHHVFQPEGKSRGNEENDNQQVGKLAAKDNQRLKPFSPRPDDFYRSY